MKASLFLEDGTIFSGISIAAEGTRCGPVVFYTGVVGYQEVITDPTNAGKILIMTYPLIGNYGINPKFNESKRSWVAGLVIKEPSQIYSNWQAEGSLNDFLQREDVVCVSELDTRTLAVKIRDNGEQWGVLSSKPIKAKAAVKKIKEEKNKKRSFLKDISIDKLTCVNSGSPLGNPKVVVVDLGICNSFLNQLKTLGYEIWLAPYNTPANELLRLNPDGVVISNGPEEDPELGGVVGTVKEILGKVPMLGISTGHQIIARALEGKISRLKVGHHGVNYPVISPNSFKGEITVQNHSFVVDEESIKDVEEVEIAERNLNDRTIAKIKSEKLKVVSIQYYPASPGFNQPNSVFSEFLKIEEKEGTRIARINE